MIDCNPRVNTTVANRCGHCGITVGFQELQMKKCMSCDQPIEIHEMQIVNDKCFNCSDVMTYRMAKPLVRVGPAFVGYLMCEKSECGAGA